VLFPALDAGTAPSEALPSYSSDVERSISSGARRGVIVVVFIDHGRFDLNIERGRARVNFLRARGYGRIAIISRLLRVGLIVEQAERQDGSLRP